MDTETVKKSAGFGLNMTISEHVLSLIENTGELSVELLLQSLQRQIDNSESAKGKRDSEDDLPRVAAEFAVKIIKERLSSNAAE